MESKPNNDMKNVDVDADARRDGFVHVLAYTPRRACKIVELANMRGDNIYYFGTDLCGDAYAEIVVDVGDQDGAELFKTYIKNM